MKRVPSFFVILILGFTLASPEGWPLAKRPPLPKESSKDSVKLPPLTLEECFGLALKRSETVAIQKEEIKEAEAQFFIAASEALGDIDFEMTRERQDPRKGGGSTSDAGSSFSDPDRRQRKFVISQPLFQGFKALGALTGAGSLKKEQKEEWRRAEQLLFLDVARAFYGLLREKKDLEIVAGVHSLLRERVKDLEEREKIGRSRPSEVATAQSRLKVIEAEQARLRGSRAVAQHVLEFLTGMDLEGQELEDDKAPEKSNLEISSYLTSLDGRPDVEAAKQSAKTAWRGVIVAQSKFWPELSIEHTQYVRREGSQSGLDWDFLFKIDVPLFQGGEAVGKMKEAVSKWKQEKLSYYLAKRQAELDIKESYENWLASFDEAESLQEAVKAAEENFRLQKDEYTHNLVNNLDVLEALESLHQTRRDANRTYYQMKENYWGLRVAVADVPDISSMAPSP